MKTLKVGDLYACGRDDTPDGVLVAAAMRHAALLVTPSAERHADQFRLGQIVGTQPDRGTGTIDAIDAAGTPGRLRVRLPSGLLRWCSPAEVVVL